MRKIDIRGDTPAIDGDDELKIESREHPFKFSGFDDQKEITELIIEAINRMGGSGKTAEEEYRVCVDRLHRDPRLVSRIVQSEYFSMPEDDYLNRWALVMLMVDVRDESNVAFFQKILDGEIPMERSKDPHSFSTVGEEVMIHTTAIDGLERIGINGNDSILDVLRGYIGHEVFSIRRSATQAMIAIGGEDMREKLKDELPQRHHELLNIRRIDVRKAEQAEGGLFLKNNDDSDIPAPFDEKSEKQ